MAMRGRRCSRCEPPGKDELDRILLGTDGPAGSGVQPLGIIRVISMLSSLGEVPAEVAFCFATGNTARMRQLDCGLVEEGRAADFVLIDKAQHSAGKDFLDSIRLGDLPGIGMAIIDGIVRVHAGGIRRRRRGDRSIGARGMRRGGEGSALERGGRGLALSAARLRP